METILEDSGEIIYKLMIRKGQADRTSLIITPVINPELTHHIFDQIELKSSVELAISGIKDRSQSPGVSNYE